MPLYPLGISRRRDIPSAPQQGEKGDRSNLCEAPFGPFRQIGPVPFFAAGSVNVRWSLSGELACAFIDAPHKAIPPMLHATILDAIHRRICVLPVRFGLALHNETEIHSLLQDRHPELLDRLSYLDSTCEMGVQIALSSPIPNPQSLIPNPQSSLAYLEQRRSFYRLADDDTEQNRLIVQQFVEGLHGHYRQWRKLSPTPLHPIRLAFLIERDCVTAFQNCVKNARRASHEGRCVVLGPWPPYSFVEAHSESLHANICGI